jgi:hypothetical protein
MMQDCFGANTPVPARAAVGILARRKHMSGEMKRSDLHVHELRSGKTIEPTA